MCGIVGYIGVKKAKPILINGLLRLEYRGYDSAGISTLENGIIETVKNKGRIKNLLEDNGEYIRIPKNYLYLENTILTHFLEV